MQISPDHADWLEDARSPVYRTNVRRYRRLRTGPAVPRPPGPPLTDCATDPEPAFKTGSGKLPQRPRRSFVSFMVAPGFAERGLLEAP
ncbi:hypothetical protein ACVW17_003657 [Bradyrhizobium sp. USDA 4473]